jgi:hypothetical protein
MPLTDTQIKGLKPAGKATKHSDGGGLHLLVSPQGSKLWRQAYRFDGKQKTLSRISTVSATTGTIPHTFRGADHCNGEKAEGDARLVGILTPDPDRKAVVSGAMLLTLMWSGAIVEGTGSSTTRCPKARPSGRPAGSVTRRTQAATRIAAAPLSASTAGVGHRARCTRRVRRQPRVPHSLSLGLLPARCARDAPRMKEPKPPARMARLMTSSLA